MRASSASDIGWIGCLAFTVVVGVPSLDSLRNRSFSLNRELLPEESVTTPPMERMATGGFKKIIPRDLAQLITAFCNEICHRRTFPVDRLAVAASRGGCRSIRSPPASSDCNVELQGSRYCACGYPLSPCAKRRGVSESAEMADDVPFVY
jgi:hypothetical protein